MKPPSATELTLLLDWIANAESYEVWEDVNEMVRERPEDAWPLIRDMVDLAPAHLLGTIAAGPLEDLLHEHGRAFVPRVVKAARADSKFQRCLSGVWLFEPKRVAQQIRRAVTSPSGKSRRDSAQISKRRAHMIARWFHHSEMSWAPHRLDELIRTDIDEAWRIILLLIQLAKEEKHDVLDDIDIHAFGLLVELRGAEAYDRILNESHKNDTIRRWIERRREWKYPRETWQGLLDKYGSMASG